jgi:ribosomal protein S18 acetylase RimI-like enzyme
VSGLVLRHAESADHAAVVGVVDEWWGGRPMAAMLPRLFFVHFRATSFVVESDGRLVGFLCGFLSQTYDDEAYVHFVGVDPAARGRGVARLLYDRFVTVVAAEGRTVVRAVTSPVNTASVAFHRTIGFTAEPAPTGYDGPGEDRVRLTLRVADWRGGTP